MTDPLVVPTRIGHAGEGTHRFRGFDVAAELAGKESYWSSVSLAIGGPRLGELEARLLDDLSVALISADPRIWPWKLCRLMSAYGNFTVGVAGPLMALAGARVGPAALPVVAGFLTELAAELGPRVDDDSALSLALDQRLSQTSRPPGFGTPFRREDERLRPIAAAVERHGRSGRKYWKLVQRVARLLLEKKRLPVNAAAALAAACLDLGFSPAQIDVLGLLLAIVNPVANAFEGAQDASEILRRLPQEYVRYQGPAPRPSPRAESATKRT
jgi:hypothetical protein